MNSVPVFSLRKIDSRWYQATCLVNKSATAVGHGVDEESAILDCKRDVEVIEGLM